MSGGVGAALSEVMEGGPTVEEIVQSGLFDDLDAAETGALDAPSPLSAALSPRANRAGRPKGSKNRRTEAVVGWLLQQHRHPLSVMMEAYSMTPAELAARIGLRKAVRIRKSKDGAETEVLLPYYANEVLLDILKLQVRMAEAVAPYIAQKLPQAVQLDMKAGLTLSFEGVSLPARGVAGQPVIEGEMAVKLPQVGQAKSETPVRG